MMRPVLVVGIASEAPIERVLHELDQLGAEYHVLHQRHAAHAELRAEIEDGHVAGTLATNGRITPLEAFGGIYARMMDVGDLPEFRSRTQRAADPAALDRAKEIHAALDAWFEIADAIVLNRGSAMASNGSKPYQQQLIERAGFATPATLVTNDPDEALAFAREHRRVVYKSISSIRSIVKELGTERHRDLAKLRALPTQFQELVVGIDVRVHVVGTEVFATRIECSAVDYRYAGREGLEPKLAPTELPDQVSARCIDLSRRLGLPLCGIDLRQTPDDRYYCFEVNPSPAFSYYEGATDQPIAAAIARLLAVGPQRT